MVAYRKRIADPLIARLLKELPALSIVGPRAAGKTTTALQYAKTVVRLDKPGEAVAFEADPDAALSGLEEPVLLDEWQSVPQILGAVKRAVDHDPRPGRFLLTGSVRADLDTESWPGTGRLVRVALYGMSIAEQLGRPDVMPLLDQLAEQKTIQQPSECPDLRGYLELALRSGFPQAGLALSEDIRAQWLESYIDQFLTRDAAILGERRNPAKLRRYFEVLALNSGGLVKDKTLYEAADINQKTAVAYEQLLVNLMMLDHVQPWYSQRLKRLTKAAKRYLIDPALLTAALRLDINGVIRDGNVLGRVLETFVVAQLRAELQVAKSRPRLYHLRDQQGRHEIDLVVELAGGDILALEIKADAAPKKESTRHLQWLQEQIGPRFIGGVVLHTGARVYPITDRIQAIPIACLWGASAS